MLFSSINPEYIHTRFSDEVNGLWLRNHVRVYKKSLLFHSTRADANSLCCELQLPGNANSSIALLTLEQNKYWQ